jgi:tetratricopeptide (TPR) repeat protein
MRLILILTVLAIGGPLNESTLSEAQRLYQAGQYQASANAYLLSLSQHPDMSSQIRFNLGQAYLRMDSIEQALMLFDQVSDPRERKIASQAANNAAVIRVRQGNYPEALQGFRRALVFNDQNETARYNFELLSKRMQPPPMDTLPPQANDDPQKVPPPPLLDEETFRQIIQNLQKSNQLGADDRGMPVGNDTISVADAQRLLKALNDQDMQFIQQLRKVPVAAPRPKGQKEW